MSDDFDERRIDHETRALIDRAAACAAEEALNRWSVRVGINATNPDDAIERQKDFAFLSNLRKMLESAQRTIGRGVLWLILAGALALLGYKADIWELIGKAPK